MAGSTYRTNSGPAPDPNSLKRKRPVDVASWTRLPGRGLVEAPEWPEEMKVEDPPTIVELAFWDRIWREFPQAHIWKRSRMEAHVVAYVRFTIRCTTSAATPPMLASMQRLGDALLINPLPMRAARVIIDEAIEEPIEESTNKYGVAPVIQIDGKGRPSARDRFKDPGEGKGEG